MLLEVLQVRCCEHGPGEAVIVDNHPNFALTNTQGVSL